MLHTKSFLELCRTSNIKPKIKMSASQKADNKQQAEQQSVRDNLNIVKLNTVSLDVLGM